MNNFKFLVTIFDDYERTREFETIEKAKAWIWNEDAEKATITNRKGKIVFSTL